MKEILNLLDNREKRGLRFLGILLSVVVLFFLLISLPQKRSYLNALSSLANKQASYIHLNTASQGKKREWFNWQEAFNDMEELKTEYFYNEKDVIKQLRRDLEQIFNETRFRVSQIRFDYSEFKKEKIKKVSASFNISGTYLSLKRFIHTVEKFPKLLMIEKIDFLKIDAEGRMLELKIILAGYFED
ncbi:MAG: hypothetical protein HQ555_01065 [Candidatus Aminicenantes bacterium]|nr:hypothetical protein [Candidatus Aminicenantes bacterium]